MLVAASVLALYFWAFMAPVETISGALLVGDSAAIIAGVALVAGFCSYLWAPKAYVFWVSLGGFGLLCLLGAALILTTGGIASPFIAFWMLLSVFAGVFGWYGIAPLFSASVGYLLYITFGGFATTGSTATIVLTALLPLIASYLIWHRQSAGEASSDRAYRRLATELSQVANKSEVVINAIADGVIALNSQGAIQLINPAAQQIIGWGKQDALSLDYKSVLKLLDKDGHELEPATDPVHQVLGTNKQIVTNNLSLRTNSNKRIVVSLSVSPVGQLGSGVIIVFRDITKEKKEEREQAEFISTASHEMRTPVATIEGYLGLALNPATAQIDDKAREFIGKAHDSAQHLGRLFADLLDISKAEDGRLQNIPKAVDVVAFTEGITDGLRPQADKKGLRLVFKPAPDGGDTQAGGERRLNPVFYANVDNDHLREVFSNLVENAIKYTPSGEVIVDITGDTDHIVISVADSGIGIPKEDQAHLFQKFYRVDNSDTREIGGTGLGLYLSRRLAETMGGRIWVESEYKQGSTFYLELPRISHEEAMRAIEVSETPESHPEIIQRTERPLPEQPTAASTAPEPIPAMPQQIPEPAQQPASQPTPQQPQPYQPLAPQPYTTPTTAPIPPRPATPYQQRTPEAQPAPVTPPVYQNTPLTHIEQNPGAYTRQQGNGIAVPPRQ